MASSQRSDFDLIRQKGQSDYVQSKTFRRQFLELISGTTIAQVFSLVLMPVISRMYSPHQMGDYALYVAIFSIVGLLANLRLDLAVVLAADDEEASRLVWLGILFSTITALVAIPLLMLLDQPLLFGLATGLSIATASIVQLFVNWHSRMTRFRLLAARNAGEKLVVLVVGIWLGWWGYTQFGLIAAQTVGLVFSTVYMWRGSGLRRPKFETALWRETFSKFSDFPRQNFLSSVLLASSIFLPSILFAACFSKDDLGQYNLAYRVFDIPINLIAYTFSTVYYQHTNTMPASKRREMFGRSLRWLILIFTAPFVVAAAFGSPIFGLVFGSQWFAAGRLAQWMAPVTGLRLLFISQGPLLLVERKLSLDLFISFLLFAAQIGGFALGYFAQHSLSAAVMWMSLLGAVVYLFGLFTVHRVLQKT